ncbi:WYL domain-containing protein [Streptomyces angustmyceticus]|uniref:WYL domain-containing protein n=1 Tax=Streptomyces angustmyceticus TaxID=285578 RepID=UPI00380FAEFE
MASGGAVGGGMAGGAAPVDSSGAADPAGSPGHGDGTASAGDWADPAGGTGSPAAGPAGDPGSLAVSAGPAGEPAAPADEGIRTFRLDRIAALTVQPGSFTVPPDFDPVTTLLEGLAQTPWAHEVSLRIHDSIEHIRKHLPAGVATLSAIPDRDAGASTGTGTGTAAATGTGTGADPGADPGADMGADPGADMGTAPVTRTATRAATATPDDAQPPDTTPKPRPDDSSAPDEAGDHTGWVHVRLRAERLDWIPPVLAALDRPFVIEHPTALRDLIRALARRLDEHATADGPPHPPI